MNNFNRRLVAMQLLSAVIIVVGVMAGLFLIQGGAERLLEPTGEDRAIPGDDVGELEILSTRTVSIHWERVAQMLLGFIVAGGSLYTVQKVKQQIPESRS